MSHSKIRIAAIGLGNRTCKYLRFVQEHQDVVELVATVDPTRQSHAPRVARTAGKAHGADSGAGLQIVKGVI